MRNFSGIYSLRRTILRTVYTLLMLYQVLAEKNAKWKRTADIVSMVTWASGMCLSLWQHPQVNKWDSRHIEEPAYEARQEGYADASELLSSETSWTVDCVLPILHNAIYTLNMVRKINTFCAN